MDEDMDGGLGVQGKQDSALFESTDNRKMVKNLCSSQKPHQWDNLLTNTCNQRNHFGTAPIKNGFKTNNG